VEIVGGTIDEKKQSVRSENRRSRVRMLAGGGYAEYATAPLLQCLPVPLACRMSRRLRCRKHSSRCGAMCSTVRQLGKGEGAPNETLLVQGGSAGIGVTAIQIAHALGFRVFAYGPGSDEKCRACEALGAERAIN